MYAYDPSHVVFGGGIANALPLFRPAMDAYLKENFPFAGNVERLHVEAQTSGEVPIIGASLL